MAWPSSTQVGSHALPIPSLRSNQVDCLPQGGLSFKEEMDLAVYPWDEESTPPIHTLCEVPPSPTAFYSSPDRGAPCPWCVVFEDPKLLASPDFVPSTANGLGLTVVPFHARSVSSLKHPVDWHYQGFPLQ